MGKIFTFWTAFLVLLVALPLTSGLADQTYHMTLLAVSERGNDSFVGSTADLYLEMRDGTGKVLMDTYPLTKSDTQLSTRFAKEVSCKFLDVDCSKYDFVYTIRAQSPIIGGPSAGAAIAALTTAALAGLPIDEGVSVTGTINSGSLVGPVGRVKEKIDAAHAKGLKKVLVPYGEKGMDGNESINLTAYGKNIGIEVVEVVDLNDVVEALTGKRMHDARQDFEIDPKYAEIMEGLSGELCDRTKGLFYDVHHGLLANDAYRFEIEADGITDKSFSKDFLPYYQTLFSNFTNSSPFDPRFFDEMANALSLYNKSLTSSANGSYYSAASFCFGANVKLNYLSLQLQNSSLTDLRKKLEGVQYAVLLFDETLEKKKYQTITDLQAYMIVRERLIEAQQYIDRANESMMNDTAEQRENLLYQLSFAIERLSSAKSWYRFYNTGTTQYDFDAETVKESCVEKISEVKERIQYVRLYLPDAQRETEEDLDMAEHYQGKGDYELCLFKASLAKAQVNVVLSMLGVSDVEGAKNLLDLKLRKAREIIASEAQNGRFPLLGYSYYEYAQSLAADDIFSALLYADYAIELSNLDMYFTKKVEPVREQFVFSPEYVLLGSVFLLGLLVGIGGGFFLFNRASSAPVNPRVSQIKRRKLSSKSSKK